MQHLTREAALDATRADPKTRAVPLSFASEHPVQRGRILEVLDHRRVDLTRARAGLPLIVSHDGDQLPIGIVENVHVDGDRLRGVARFGSSPRASEIFADVVGGILRHVSVGYTATDPLDGPGGTTRYAFAPHEVSLVAIAADPTVGVGRSFKKDSTMQVTENAGTPGPSNRGTLGERERAESILSIGNKFAAPAELTRQAIAEGWTAAAYGERVLSDLADARQAAGQVAGGSQASMIGMSTTETKTYSLARALTALAENKPQLAGLEMEASAAMARQLGRQPRGIFVPTDVLRRDMTAASATLGGRLVGTDHMAGSFIDFLYRESMFLGTLGATRMPGLRGNVSIPKQTGTGTAYWLANETTAITESDVAVGQVTMTPKNCAALTEISKQLLLQSAPSVETVVLNDLARAVALAVDSAVLNGTGLSGQPTGILAAAGIGSFGATSCDWAKLLAAQQDLADANALNGRCVYLTNVANAALLMARARFASTDTPLWSGSLLEGQVGGLRAVASSIVPAGRLVLLDPAQVVIGEWGALELEVNPFFGFTTGSIAIRAWYSVDVALRHAGAVTVATDFT